MHGEEVVSVQTHPTGVFMNPETTLTLNLQKSRVKISCGYGVDKAPQNYCVVWPLGSRELRDLKSARLYILTI